jgi:hypothetical protein
MRWSALRSCLIAASLAACSTTPDGTGNGQPGTSGGNDAGVTEGGTTVQCGASGGNSLECLAKIAVADNGSTVETNSALQIPAGDLAPGQVRTDHFAITNPGTAVLGINSIKLTYDTQTPEEANDPAFTCVTGPDGAKTPCNTTQFPGVSPGGAPVTFEVNFKKFADDTKRSAKLVISTNDKKLPSFVLVFVTTAGQARIQLSPPQLDFGFVAVGGNPVKSTDVLNVGNSTLHVDSIDRTQLDPTLFEVALADDQGHTIAQTAAFDIVAGGKIKATVVYTAKDDKPHLANLIFKTNDPTLTSDGGPGWKILKVKVNSSGPCLKIEPADVVFGASGVGVPTTRPITLSSCGDQKVCVSDVTFDAPGAGPFALDWTGAPGGKTPTKDAPLCIDVNAKVTVLGRYTPVQLSKKDASGQPIPDKASMTVTSDSGVGKTKVTLQGVGASGDCPTGIITVAEGDTVTPQTTLHLDGKQSYVTSGGKITGYKWTVQQPKGSVSVIGPNSTSPGITFTPNVAGDYKFQLTVTDSSGKPSCFPAEKVVKVLPDQAIHVELLWDTPGDQDQTNEGPDAGADMDLHFAHKYATMPDYDKDGKADPWFSDAYDCFWFNCATSGGKALEWGSYDPNIDDNPHLDRDDTDGAGPENLNLTLPEDDKTYYIGVHYFKDHGFGPSIATVKVFVYGNIVFEHKSTSMVQGDLWTVGFIDWPSGDVTLSKNPKDPAVLRITPKYPAPSL